MKFYDFINENKKSNAIEILEDYLNDPTHGYRINDIVFEELLNDYSNKDEITIYRGMNFATEDDYNKFMDSMDGKKITFKTISSWTRHKKTAFQFAVTRPSYMEYMDSSDMKLIQKASKESEGVVGYRGIILKATIKPNTAIDVNRTEIGKEDEIILAPKSTIEVEYTLQYKNSDKIKKDGISKILNQYVDQSEDVDHSMITHIINNHADKLTDSDKKIIGKFLLVVEDDREIINVSKEKSRDNKGDDIVVRMRYNSYIDQYENVFLEDDIKKYKERVATVLKKGLNEVLGYLKSYDNPSDVHIDWVTNNDKVKLFKDFGVHDLYKDIVAFFAKEYSKMNDDVRDSKKSYSKKDIDSFSKKIEMLLRSI